MKAVRIHRYGGVEQLCYEDAPEPILDSPQDVIVKLKAAGLSHHDLRIRRGETSDCVSLPLILGAEGAGVVVERGSEATHVSVGDAVCLFPVTGCGHCQDCASDRESLCGRLRVLGAHLNGCYAEYVRVPGRNCFPLPKRLSCAEAAALPLAFSTAWHMLFGEAKLEPGEWILIRGVGGGVAAAAMQLALSYGAHIIVTSRSDEKLARAKEVGAVHGINSTQCDFAAEVRRVTGKRGVDVVVDCIGGEGWVSSLAALARGGRLVTCGASAGGDVKTNLQRIFWNHLQVLGSGFASRREFHQLVNFFTTTKVKPMLDKVYALRDAAKGQARLEAGKQFGKIILSMEN